MTIFLAKIRDFPFVAMSVHNILQGSWSMLRRAVLQETWVSLLHASTAAYTLRSCTLV